VDYRNFGAARIALPRIGQGTWEFPEHGARRNEAKAALRRGVELGMVHIDTAEMYGSGRVEELIAEALDGLRREQVFLASKVLPANASFKQTIAACERSLRRLRTNYLDLYLLHWPGSFPIEETMGAMEQLISEGKVRYIGVSNFDVEELKAARNALDREPLVCNQVLYHLRERGIETRLLPFCKERDVAVVAYTPFGRGRFPGAGASPGVLERIAKKNDKSVRQVILNFLTRDQNVFTIPKASRREHVEENAAAAGWELPADDVRAIDEAFPVSDVGRLATL